MRSNRWVRFFFALLLTASLAPRARGQGIGFASKVYPTGSGPVAVATGDFDADGKLDLATANSAGNSVTILLGNGDGSFVVKREFSTGQIPTGIASGDVNGDGKLDLVTCNQGTNTVSILLGIGDGTFGPSTDFATGTGPVAILLADLNGDGVLDVVTANFNANTVSVQLGNGDGTLRPSVDYPTGTGPSAIVAGDFNNDGKPDLTTANATANSISLLLGNGDGTFGLKSDFPTEIEPVSLDKGDFRGDSKLDLVAAARVAAVVSLLPGKGDGTFDPKTDLGTDTEPIAVTSADFNADGKLDFLVASSGYHYYYYYGSIRRGYYVPAVALLPGNGDGSFKNSVSFPLPLVPAGMVTGDFNGDGRIDVAIANTGDDRVTVVLQSPFLNLDPGRLTFSTQATGTTSAPLTVTVQSTGSFPLHVNNALITGGNEGEFSIASDTCSNNAVPSGESCTVSAVFAPSSPGTKYSELEIHSDSPSAPDLIYLSGRAASAGIATPSPTAVDFGNQPVKTMSTPRQVLVTNTGTGPLSVNGVSAAGDFSIASTTCGSAVLALGAQCSFNVSFSPSGPGPVAGTLTISSDSLSSPTLVALSGNGVPGPQVVISPASVTFAPQLVGVASAGSSVTITNSGGADLSITGISATNLSIFALSHNCPTALSPGSSCTATITFTPLGSLRYIGTLSIADNLTTSPQTVPLSGDGIDFGIAVTSQFSSITVRAGQSASFGMAFPATGYSGTATLSCSHQIPLGGCTVTPSSVGVGGAPQNATVTVTTTGNALLIPEPRDPSPIPVPGVVQMWVMVLLLGVILLETRRIKSLRPGLAFCLMMLLGISLMACGGEQVQKNQLRTPSGTYKVTVAAASGGATRTVDLTVIVK